MRRRVFRFHPQLQFFLRTNGFQLSAVNLKNSDAVKRLIFETITKLNSDNSEEKNHFDFYFTEISAQQHLCIKSNSVKQHKQYNEKNEGSEPGQRHANSKKTLNRLYCEIESLHAVFPLFLFMIVERKTCPHGFTGHILPEMPLIM